MREGGREGGRQGGRMGADHRKHLTTATRAGQR